MQKLYQTKIFPYLMNINLSNAEVINYRRQLLKQAAGNILEIGIGTGINLSLYPDCITGITAVDTFVRELPNSRIKVSLYNESADNMSFNDNTFDTVVSTFTFCSVNNPEKTLKEIARVLKPNGMLLFLEHGEAPKHPLQILQNIVNPLFNIFACGCNVNRNHFDIISSCGFILKKQNIHLTRLFPKCIVGYIYEGVAVNDKI